MPYCLLTSSLSEMCWRMNCHVTYLLGLDKYFSCRSLGNVPMNKILSSVGFWRMAPPYLFMAVSHSDMCFNNVFSVEHDG